VVRAGAYLDRGELDKLLTQAKAAAAAAGSSPPTK
jgi:Zn-finger nucleic acid-binding protein